MFINSSNHHVTLSFGETFLYEEQDADNIWRTMHFAMPNSGEVTVQRHFSQIGPVVTDHEGFKLNTTVVNGKVVSYESQPCRDSFEGRHVEITRHVGPGGFITQMECGNCHIFLRVKQES